MDQIRYKKVTPFFFKNRISHFSLDFYHIFQIFKPHNIAFFTTYYNYFYYTYYNYHYSHKGLKSPEKFIFGWLTKRIKPYIISLTYYLTYYNLYISKHIHWLSTFLCIENENMSWFRDRKPYITSFTILSTVCEWFGKPVKFNVVFLYHTNQYLFE